MSAFDPLQTLARRLDYVRMRAVVRLFWVGCALMALQVLRAFAFPIFEPADPEHPSFLAVVSNYSLLLWVPAVACLALAAVMWLRLVALRWIEHR